MTEGGSAIIRHAGRKAGFEEAVGSEMTIEQIEKHIERFVGPIEKVFHELVSDLVHLDLYHVKPGPERPFHTFVTCGMSESYFWRSYHCTRKKWISSSAKGVTGCSAAFSRQE